LAGLWLIAGDDDRIDAGLSPPLRSGHELVEVARR